MYREHFTSANARALLSLTGQTLEEIYGDAAQGDPFAKEFIKDLTDYEAADYQYTQRLEIVRGLSHRLLTETMEGTSLGPETEELQNHVIAAAEAARQMRLSKEKVVGIIHLRQSLGGK